MIKIWIHYALTHIVIVSDSLNSGCKKEYLSNWLYFEKIQSAESPRFIRAKDSADSHISSLIETVLLAEPRLRVPFQLPWNYDNSVSYNTRNIGRVQKFPISDRFCKIHRSSLNTEPIRIILSAFERREHSQDNPRFKIAKILFFGLGRTYKVYFRRWICLNHGLHDSGTYGALWVGSNICKPCI
jgi:hypothetical protein